MIFCLFINSLSFAQKGGSGIDPRIIEQAKPSTTSDHATSLECTSKTLNGCNYIRNNNFTPSSAYNPLNFNHFVDPFEASPFFMVPEWAASHGSPQISDGVYNFTTNT